MTLRSPEKLMQKVACAGFNYMINFSFIIPHKNTPELLQKCLDSIPRRDDVQIIVVDDNSDSDKVDFSGFPGINDPFVEVYLTKEGKGAGYARNVGLEHAVGKWLVFADADDFFNPSIAEAMDSFCDEHADVVFFLGNAIKLSDGSVSFRGEEMNRRVKLGLSSGDYSQALMFSSPCKKFISHQLLLEHNITFHEVRWSNDVVFMAKVALYARTCMGSDLSIYCITESDNSLVKDPSIESQVVRLKEECEEVRLLRKHFSLDENMHYWLFMRWFGIYKRKKIIGLFLLPRTIYSSKIDFLKQAWKAKFKK